MAYVYRHIRRDKNVPFYIGISNKDNKSRAYNTSKRNNHWKSIVAKTEYDVEIVMEGLTWEEAQQKEKEFIALYKKTVNGGTLCNQTDGGDGGNLGPEMSKKFSRARQGHLNKRAFKVYQYTISGKFVKEWECCKYACDHYKINHANISDCIRGKQKTAAGFKWSKIKLHED